MKKVIKLCSLLCALIVLVAVVVTLAMSVTAATETTLTVTPEGGTTQTFNGTYQEMETKVDTLMAANPTVKTEYVITLNSNITMPKAGSFGGNENCYVTINLNGYTLTTGFTNNLWLLSQSVHFTLDGANAKGENGKIINHQTAGGLIYTQNKTENNGVVADIKNVEYTATNMSSGYSDKAQYPDQPMFHVNRGNISVTNVKMVYTGENAYEIEGNSAGKPLNQMTMRFFQIGGNVNVYIDGCELIDTNTKGIQTRGINSDSTGAVHVKNTKIVARDAIHCSKTIVVEDCDIKASHAAFDAAGKIYVTDTAIATDTGIVANNTNATLELRSSGDKNTVIYSTKALQGKYTTAVGFELLQTTTGVYKVVPNGSVGATLSAVPKTGAPSYYSGTYQEMHAQLQTLLKATSAIDADYELVLHTDAVYEAFLGLNCNNTGTVNVRIDFNGHKLSSSIDNNIYQVVGNTTGNFNFSVDGADADGKLGEYYSTGFAGALVYTRPNDNKCINVTVEITNINATHTNMSAGIGNTSPYPDQPMLNLAAGKYIHVKNYNVTFTAEDATALEGNSLGKLRTPIIQIANPAEVLIEDCVIKGTNLNNIKSKGISFNGSGKVTVKNTTITDAAYGVYCSKNTGMIEFTDCDIFGKLATFDGQGYVKVIDTICRTAKGNKIVNYPDCVYFLYGEGKTAFNRNETGNVPVIQDGYTLALENGFYVMKPDTSVEATLAVNPEKALPTFYTGSFDDMAAKLNNIQPTVRTEYILSLNKDANYNTGYGKTFNSNVYCKIDLNGHTLNASYSSNLFQIVGNYHFEIDGSDKDGNIGTVRSTGAAGSLIYPRANDGKNDYTVISIHDLNMYYTNLSSGFSDDGQWPNQQAMNIPAGTVTIENVKLTYTGEDVTAKAGANLAEMKTPLIQISGNADVTINNCDIVDNNKKGIQPIGIYHTGAKLVKVTNSTVSAFTAIKSTSTKSSMVFENCTLVGNYRVFEGNSTPTTIIDTVIDVKTYFATTGAKIHFMYGTGKNEVKTTGGNTLNGTYTTEDGYYLCAVADGKFIVSDGQGYSTVSLPNIFQSGMVFQREKDLSVFGYCATDGAKIKVTFNGKEEIATVEDGQWKATFDPMSASKGLTLKVEQLDVAVPVVLTYDNVDIGEVWLMGGQSNSQYELYKMEDAEEYIANADNFDNIRVYHATSTTAGAPLTHGSSSKWRQVTSETLKKTSDISGQVSAIAYVMATRLATELDDNVTIAILDVNYNGSGIQTWIEEGLYAENFGNDVVTMTKYNEYKNFWLENGRLPNDASEAAGYAQKPYNWLPSGNYNAMMANMLGFEIKGTIWMQGCTNYSWTNYEDYYEVLMQTFRMTFDDDTLPCFVIQLQPYGEGVNNDFRSIQYTMTDNDPYSYLVTAATGGAVFCESDFANNSGDTSLVHPARKSLTGQRLADAILYNMYGFEEYKDALAPKVTKVEANGNKLIVTFDCNVKTELGTAVEGFEIAGEDGTFVKANGTIDGNKVILVADGVTAPKTVRYGYGKFLIELQDGTLVPYDRKTKAPVYTTEYMTIYGPNGEEYTFERGTDIVIRSLFQGNLTNASGNPTPVFKLDVGYVAE